jgi:molecular chaperone DnaK
VETVLDASNLEIKWTVKDVLYPRPEFAKVSLKHRELKDEHLLKFFGVFQTLNGDNLREIVERNVSIALTHSETKATYQCPTVLVTFVPTRTFGIDLGTTYTQVARHDSYQHATVLVVDPVRDRKLEATLMYFAKDGAVHFGDDALENVGNDFENFVQHIKLIAGRHFRDKEVGVYQRTHSIRLREDPKRKNEILIDIPNLRKSFSPTELMALFLKHIITRVDPYFLIDGITKPKVLVSKPAYFHIGQGRAIIDAVRIVDCELIDFAVEPTSAGVAVMKALRDPNQAKTQFADFAENAALVAKRLLTSGQVFAILDLGGGTFDVSMMMCNRITRCNVIKVAGNSTLGGSHFDVVLADMIMEKIDAVHGAKVWNEQNRSAVYASAEQYKLNLVTNKAGCPFNVDRGGAMLSVSMTLDEFQKDARVQQLLESAWEVVARAFTNVEIRQASGMAQVKPDLVILVGGASKLPIFKEFIERKFSANAGDFNVNKDKKVRVLHPVDCEYKVAIGSAFLAESLVTVNDVLALPLGFEIVDTHDEDEQAKMDTVIDKNRPYPARESKKYCQYNPEDTEIDLKLIQGDCELAEECYLVGTIHLSNVLARDPRNVNCDNVLVEVELRKDQVVRVTAHYNDQKVTGDISVRAETGMLSDEQVEESRRKVSDLLD